MATISENLQTLATAKENIKSAIQEKGQDLTDVPFTQYADKISDIQTGGGVDRLQWKCDNMKSLYYEFYKYTGNDLNDILNGLDTSKVEDWRSSFFNCTTLKNFSFINLENAKNMSYAFQHCSELEYNGDIVLNNVTNMTYALYGCAKLTGSLIVNSPNCSDYSQAFRKSGFSEISINVETPASLYGVCESCDNLKKIILTDTKNVKSFNSAFEYNYILESISTLDLSSSTNGNNMFQADYALKEVHLKNTQNCPTFNYTFVRCYALETLETLDLYGCTNNSGMLQYCTNLKNLTIKNIKINLTIGSGSSEVNMYGHLLTNASLLNTAQELWDNTNNALGGTRTLTMSTPSRTAIQSIYVKLIDVSDDMRANDQYVDNKKPCVECASTDDGAMTLQEYIISKNWTIG